MESITAIKIITFFYILFNSGRVFSYIPQIIAVFKEQTPVLAISLVTWSFWTAANLTTALYATVVLHDALLTAMSYGNTLGCAIVVAIVVYKRYKFNYWPVSKRNQVFKTTHVTSFTEVPNLDAEEIYHFFDVADDSDENHTVTFSKKFNHEDIETFDSFLEMTKEAKENFTPELLEKVETPVVEPITELLLTTDVVIEPVESIKEVINELPEVLKKRPKKKKEPSLIQVETKVDEVKQEIELPVEPITEIVVNTDTEPDITDKPSPVVISPLQPIASASKKKIYNSRKRK